jgi:hypothetical protein
MQGVFGSAFQVGVSTWCLHKTGPVFVAMFKPLGIVIAAAVSIICLRDTLYLGRYIFFFLFLFEGGNRFDILSCCQVGSIPTLLYFLSLYNKEKTQGTSFTILVEIFSLVGATVIVIGFYSVMWGKAKEEKVGVDDGVRSFESSSQKVPLLQSHTEET